jgi:hypothetical protein
MFFFKRKEIIVDCFTYLEAVALNFPIDRAIKFYPKEFKNLPREIELKHNQDPQSKLSIKLPSIKSCTGITDLYSNGFIIPAWDSFSIEMLEDNKYTIYSKSNTVNGEWHSRGQYGNIYSNSAHIKLLSPWMLKEKTGVKFVWMPAGWSNTENAEIATIPPAVVDYKYQFNTHISMFIKKGGIVNYNIGDPIVHIMPISEYKVKVKTHVIDEATWHKERIAIEKFTHFPNHRKLNYPNFFEERKTCPFGFGK